MLSLWRTLSARYWRRHVARALLVAASIALGAATCAATGALQHTLDEALRKAAAPLAGEADFFIGNGDAGVLRELAEPVAAVPGVRSVRPLVVQRIVLPELGQRPALLLGLDLPDEPGDEPAWSVQISDRAGEAFLRGMMLSRKPALLGRELDRALPAEASQLTVLAGGQPHRLLRAGAIDGRGPAASLSGDVVVLACEDAAALLGRPDRVTRLDVRLTPGADREAVRRQVEEIVGDRAGVSTPDGHDERMQEMLSGLKVAFSLCGAGALVVGIFLVANALAVSVAERRHDIGMLRALGASRPQLALLFLGEAAALGVAGSGVGLPLGLALAHLSLGPMRDILGDLFLPLPECPLEVTAGPLLWSALAGLTAALSAGVLPAVLAAREGPADALRRAPTADRMPRGQIAVVLGLLAMGLCGAAFGRHLPGRWGVFAGLVLLIVAVLLAVPALTALAARLLQTAVRFLPGLAPRLAADNLLRQPGRTGLVVSATAAGVALLLQTGGLIRSNEAVVREWVDGSVAGDLFITCGGPLSASGRTLPMGEPVADRLRAEFPEMQVVAMRFRYLDWRHDGQPTRVRLLALDAAAYHAANRDRQPPLPGLDLYPQLCEPGTALVSENFAALYGVRAGDTITLPGADGPVSLRVLGAVADCSCNRGTIMVDRGQFRRAFDADLIDVLDVYLPPGADAGVVRERVARQPWAGAFGLSVLTREELRGHILGMVSRLYGLAYTQEVVVGIVALLGVVTALLISVLQRRRELGLLRAVGATRGQVVRAVLAEAVFLGGLGALAGVLAGVPLEWYTVRVLLFEESGFLCPVCFPWASAAAVVGLTLASAALAGIGPALHAARPAVVEAIAYE